MENKKFKYHKYVFNWIIIYSCNTDFSKYRYSPEFSLYLKGKYRGFPNVYVVKIRNIIKTPIKEEIHLFKTKKDGLDFIKNEIKKLK